MPVLTMLRRLALVSQMERSQILPIKAVSSPFTTSAQSWVPSLVAGSQIELAVSMVSFWLQSSLLSAVLCRRLLNPLTSSWLLESSLGLVQGHSLRSSRFTSQKFPRQAIVEASLDMCLSRTTWGSALHTGLVNSPLDNDPVG